MRIKLRRKTFKAMLQIQDYTKQLLETLKTLPTSPTISIVIIRLENLLSDLINETFDKPISNQETKELHTIIKIAQDSINRYVDYLETDVNKIEKTPELPIIRTIMLSNLNIGVNILRLATEIYDTIDLLKTDMP